MKKLALVAVVAIFFIAGCFPLHPGVFRHGGGHFWGGIAAGALVGAIIAPMFYAPLAPVPSCYNRVVRPGYYAYDSR